MRLDQFRQAVFGAIAAAYAVMRPFGRTPQIGQLVLPPVRGIHAGLELLQPDELRAQRIVVVGRLDEAGIGFLAHLGIGAEQAVPHAQDLAVIAALCCKSNKAMVDSIINGGGHIGNGTSR